MEYIYKPVSLHLTHFRMISIYGNDHCSHEGGLYFDKRFQKEDRSIIEKSSTILEKFLEVVDRRPK